MYKPGTSTYYSIILIIIFLYLYIDVKAQKSLRIGSTPQKADVYINDFFMGKTPLIIRKRALFRKGIFQRNGRKEEKYFEIKIEKKNFFPEIKNEVAIKKNRTATRIAGTGLMLLGASSISLEGDEDDEGRRTLSALSILAGMYMALQPTYKMKFSSSTIHIKLKSNGYFPSKEKESLTTSIYNIDSDLPKTNMEGKDDIAVIIGNRDYDEVSNVDYALNDSRSIKVYCEKVLGLKSERIFYYENAGKIDFDRLFGTATNYKGRVYKSVRKNISSLYVFYIGHGISKDNRTYFVPIDAAINDIDLTGYSVDLFNHNLAQVPAKFILIVTDACFSGRNIHKELKVSGFIRTKATKIAALDNGIFFASSTGDQYSTWFEEAQHGTFTYFFLKGIHNKNADIDKDDMLTFKELFEYVSDENYGVPYEAQFRNGFEQTPTIESKNPEILEQVFIKYE